MINLRALEDVFDDNIPECKAHWEAAKGKPQYTPAEIAECYPNLNKEAVRGGYIRFFGSLPKEEVDEVTQHVWLTIKHIPRLRGADRIEAWTYFTELYPNERAAVRKQLFIDFVLNFCIPSDSKKENAQFLEEAADPKYDYEARLHREYAELTPAILTEYSAQYMRKERELEAELEANYHVRLEDELMAVQQGLDAIEIIQRIWDKEYYSIFNLLIAQFTKFIGSRVALTTVAPYVLAYLVVYCR